MPSSRVGVREEQKVKEGRLRRLIEYWTLDEAQLVYFVVFFLYFICLTYILIIRAEILVKE